MPGFYADNEYDLAGFCVGVVESDKLIDGSVIRVGDKIIGIASSGLHSNGYSLARKVLFDVQGMTGQEMLDGLSSSIGMELLTPTRIYVKPMLNLLKNFIIKGIVHITGGGFIDNIPRIVPGPCKAVISKGSWKIPPIFSIIQKLGNIDELEMHRVFNMGIGMMIVVSEKDASEIINRLAKLGETAYCIGTIEKREKNQPLVEII
jgi:phosphoribosylformylglycinamidine cyclo-ligase